MMQTTETVAEEEALQADPALLPFSCSENRMATFLLIC